ncbi:MAG: 2-oxoglutarate dehydrogenase complex dihydrolipoyllysine-residue succinyltransferase [Chromatiales bacterium]|nr:2-oxoglutarate dehydrogenase complex dihydrolipoyllysine-residue succinyltransferase [Chromatiales bacterium]
MSTEIKIPPLPESVADATIVTWHKQPGERVEQDENLVDIETDKVVLEVPAPAAGVLKQIDQDEGATVTAGQVIGLLEARETGKPADAGEEKTAARAAPALSPAVRKLLHEHELDPAKIDGSGKDGRILKEDVLAHLEARQQEKPAPQPAARQETPPAADTPAAKPAAAPAASDERTEKRVPMTRLRKRIAERLIEAQQTAAMLTTFNEVNMAPVMALRKTHRDRFEKAHGVRLGFMSFFVKACVEALRRFPEVNASIDGDDIVYHGFFDIGVAVSSPRGLVVPILRAADQLGFADIEKRIADLGQRAQDGKLDMDELTGGTFTISNGGVFGSLLSTPILNPPQSGILGMHKIEERPVVENGEIVIRPMMYLALSYDHRLIDGSSAVRFLVTVKDMLEDPARLLLEV